MGREIIEIEDRRGQKVSLSGHGDRYQLTLHGPQDRQFQFAETGIMYADLSAKDVLRLVAAIIKDAMA